MLALVISGDQLQCLFYDARETKGIASTKETRRRQTREDVSAYTSLMIKEKKQEGDERDTYPPQTAFMARLHMKHDDKHEFNKVCVWGSETERISGW